MSYSANLWVFFVLLAGIVLVPGMDMLFVLTQSLAGGLRKGLAATAGMMLGGVFHTVFGSLAVGMILKIMPGFLNVILLAGSCYMMWIGFGLLRTEPGLPHDLPTVKASYRKVFGQGAITCILNPKAYMFVFAVYPQFLRAEYGSLLLQSIVFGALTVFTQFAIYGGVAAGAAGIGKLFAEQPGIALWISRAAGIIFLTIATITFAEVMIPAVMF